MDEQPFDSVLLLLLLLLHVFSSPLSLPFPSICVLTPLDGFFPRRWVFNYRTAPEPQLGEASLVI